MAGYGKPKSGKRNYLVIGIAVFVVAVVIYFMFFTRKPDEGTRVDTDLQPAAQSETPAPANPTPTQPPQAPAN